MNRRLLPWIAFSMIAACGSVSATDAAIPADAPSTLDASTTRDAMSLGDASLPDAPVAGDFASPPDAAVAGDFASPPDAARAADLAPLPDLVAVIDLALPDLYVPTCSDRVQNGQETDIDCGGPMCPRCSATRHCQTGADCISGKCISSICQALSVSMGSPVYLPAGGRTDGVAAGDFNGDGWLDIVTSNYAANTVSLLLNDKAGGFVASTTVAVGAAPAMIVTGDFDGDKKLDALVAVTGAAALLHGDGKAGLTPSSLFPLSGINGVLFANIDNDTSLDIIATDNGEIRCYLNDGRGGFKAMTTVSTSGGTGFPAVADVNRDGSPDVVVQASSGIEYFSGDGNGTFRSVQKKMTTASSPDVFGLADFNGDGFPDVAAGAYTGSGTGLSIVSVWLNNTQSGFGLRTDYPAGPVVATGGFGDFDRDGTLDIVTGNFGDGSISILTNDGSGTFTPKATVPMGVVNLSALVVADFNQDGKPDIVVNDQTQSRVALVYNTSR